MENVLPGILPKLKDQPDMLVPDVDGFISAKVKKLLNMLVAKLPPNECYFEVGCLKGASLISACLDHKDATVYACDNFSENPDQEGKKHFYENLKKYEDRLPKIEFFEEDCFSLPALAPFQKPIGLYFYDGGHAQVEQKMAITEFKQFFAPTLILLVDDWNWDYVRIGTWEGIHALRPRQVLFYELPARYNCDRENWWNGIGAFYIER